jgi:general secretion pathway protein F
MAETGDLPWATTALMSMSHFAQKYWYIALAIIAAIGYFAKQWVESKEGRAKLDRIRLKTIGLGRIVRSLSIARFCRVLGTLLHNGVPLLQSLRIAKDASGNVVISEAVADAADHITSGKSLAKPLAAGGEFPKEIVEMIAVGEEANNLENVLIDIADSLERRTNREVEMVVRLLEPLLLLCMAAVVLFVVIAILLPILQTSSIVS